MRILSIDTNKAEVDFYLRCMEAGHKVKCYIKQDEVSKNIGRGILDIVDDWKDWIDWCDMVYMADNSKLVPQMDALRARGIKVFGPTVKSAKWELDRMTGQDMFDKCGIDTIPSESFNDYDKAIEYVKKTGGRLVSKPCGDADKALSYVSKTPADMIFMLQRWKEMYPGKCDIIIQKFIPGIEMAVGGWFGPNGFNNGWLENFEFKKLMNDDISVNTGEMGTVIRYVQESKLADMMLLPLVAELKKSGHTGYVDVAVIISQDGTPWPLEFTMRPGYPTFNIQQELHSGDPADWMLQLLEGEDADNIIYDKVATGVIIAIPDFPFCNAPPEDSVGMPIFGMEIPLEDSMHPCEVMMGQIPNDEGKEEEGLVTSGSYVAVCTGIGKTVKDSSDKAYKTVDKINIPGGMAYRTDIGCRLEDQLPELQKHGFAEKLKYE
jgi:phosphoribosylamine--glycine ligase